jgi:hypothetical protein
VRDAEVERPLDPPQAQDDRPRRAQPTDAEPAPGNLAERARGQHPLRGERPERRAGIAGVVELVEHRVLDDRELVLRSKRGESLAAVFGGPPPGRVVARWRDVERVDMRAVEQPLELVDP